MVLSLFTLVLLASLICNIRAFPSINDECRAIPIYHTLTPSIVLFLLQIVVVATLSRVCLGGWPITSVKLTVVLKSTIPSSNLDPRIRGELAQVLCNKCSNG